MAPKTLGGGTSEAVDDYLKAILELGGAEDDRVSSQALAQRLEIRTPSVTGMLQRLAAQRPAMVQYEKHRGVRLTSAGRRRAWELVRHHRLIELFLHDVLKYSWDEVHEEAERLEHFISERFEDRVAAILGDPQFDPHGHLIPQKWESGAFPAETPLTRATIGRPVLIRSVSDRDSAALRELERMSLTPGVTLTVEDQNPAGTLHVRIAGHNTVSRVSRDLAERVLVSAA